MLQMIISSVHSIAECSIQESVAFCCIFMCVCLYCISFDTAQYDKCSAREQKRWTMVRSVRKEHSSQPWMCVCVSVQQSTYTMSLFEDRRGSLLPGRGRSMPTRSDLEFLLSSACASSYDGG